MGRFVPFWTVWTVLDPTVLDCLDRLDHSGLFWTFGLFWAVLDLLDRLDRFGPLWTIVDQLDRLDHPGPFWTILDCLDHSGPFWTISDHFGLGCQVKKIEEVVLREVKA